MVYDEEYNMSLLLVIVILRVLNVIRNLSPLQYNEWVLGFCSWKGITFLLPTKFISSHCLVCSVYKAGCASTRSFKYEFNPRLMNE